MTDIKSKPGLLNFFDKRSTEVKWYFEHLPRLVEDFPFEISLAYVFSRVELAHNMALYCGAIKLHKVHGELARRAVRSHHMTRAEFLKRFATIYGTDIPPGTTILLTKAEAVRDLVMHGKSTTAEHMRNAVANVLSYSENLNEHVRERHGPKPFGDLRGFRGRGESLSPETSRWILRGMGFNL